MAQYWTNNEGCSSQRHVLWRAMALGYTACAGCAPTSGADRHTMDLLPYWSVAQSVYAEPMGSVKSSYSELRPSIQRLAC